MLQRKRSGQLWKICGSWGSLFLPGVYFLELRLHWCANFKRVSASHLIALSSVRQIQQRTAHRRRTVAHKWNQAQKVLTVVSALLQTFILQLCSLTWCVWLFCICWLTVFIFQLICVSLVVFSFLPAFRVVSHKSKWNIIWLNVCKDATRFHISSKPVSKSSDGAAVPYGIFPFISFIFQWQRKRSENSARQKRRCAEQLSHLTTKQHTAVLLRREIIQLE